MNNRRHTEKSLCAFCFGGSAPEGGQHGNDLLFAGKDMGEKRLLILQLDIESLLHRLLVTDAENLGALQQHIGEHENDHIVVLLCLGLLHQLEEFGLLLQQTVAVGAGDLADAEVVAGQMELLEIGEQQLVCRLWLRGGGEDKGLGSGEKVVW